MSVRVDVRYEGDLHCVAVHEPSGDRLPTDAPVDNQGQGRHFSPTDLVGTALGTCMLTIMGLAAKARDIDLTGAHAVVHKEMGAEPVRHIARLEVVITLPPGIEPRHHAILEQAALTCPVHASLGERTTIDLKIVAG